MLESLSSTDTLALFIGLYMLAAGIGLLIDPKGYGGLIDELRASVAVAYIAAILAFVFGAIIVAFHNVWTNSTAILVSLIGWAGLMEGLLLLAFRQTFLNLVGAIPLTARTMVPFGMITILTAQQGQ